MKGLWLKFLIFVLLFESCLPPQAFFMSKKPTYYAKAPFIKTFHRQIDTSSQKILLVGDSMVGVLRWKFRDYCQYNGHQLYVVLWDAANTIWFSLHDTLKFYIDKIKPSYIFIVLGANELFVPNIKKRKKYIEKILRQIGDIPFVWVGPPNWKKDTGINELLLQTLGFAHFYPTYKISLNNPNFKRYKDGAHPLPSAAQLWMDSLAVWVMNYSAHPIKLFKPPKKGNMKFKLFYLAPMIDTSLKDSLNRIDTL